MTAPAAADVPSISRAELVAALRRGQVVLVDVLSRESFNANHIDGAINLALEDIPARARQVLPDRSAAIVVYCGGPT